MVYEQFQETVRDTLQKLLGPAHHLTIRPILKNNGILLDGLSDHPEGKTFAPTIYLNPYYDHYIQGTLSIDEICLDIKEIFTANPSPSGLYTNKLTNYPDIQPLVMMKLVHADSNRELLMDVPYVPYLDLAIVFYLALGQNESHQMSVLIHNDHMEQWQANVHDLLTLAAQNTERLYPAQISGMTDLLQKIAQDNFQDDYDKTALDLSLQQEHSLFPLYVLTNPAGIYGAVGILYKNVLKNFAALLQKDLIIIPSSVHEVLLTPYNPGDDLLELNQMVSAVNQQEVSPEDRLSDHIYRYERSTDKITIPQPQEAFF